MNDNLPPMTFKERCTVAVECLPNAPYRTLLANLLDEMLAAIEKDRERHSVPAGWKLVPIEPTEAMIDATYVGQHCSDIWRDMIEAAPQPQPVPPSQFGSPELGAMILARCVEKDQRPVTGLILPKHRDPLTGAGIPDPTTFGGAA